MGSVVKLLAIASWSTPTAPGVSVRVHPAMIPRTHPLASVREAFNAVFVESEAAGQLMFYGPGAGGSPTAQRRAGRPGHRRPQPARRRPAAPASRRTPTGRCCRWGRPAPATTSPIDVDDRAGVLAAVATAFAEQDVSIQTVRQEGRGADAQLVVVSHDAHRRAAGRAPSTRCAGMACVREVTSVMRVEGMAD